MPADRLSYETPSMTRSRTTASRSWGLHGADPDAAVTLHDTGDAMFGPGAEQAVPDGLRVVVCMDIDSAGRDHEPGCVNGSAGRRADRAVAAIRPSFSATSARKAAAQVPSTTLPPVIRMSYVMRCFRYWTSPGERRVWDRAGAVSITVFSRDASLFANFWR